MEEGEAAWLAAARRGLGRVLQGRLSEQVSQVALGVAAALCLACGDASSAWLVRQPAAPACGVDERL